MRGTHAERLADKTAPRGVRCGALLDGLSLPRHVHEPGKTALARQTMQGPGRLTPELTRRPTVSTARVTHRVDESRAEGGRVE